MSEGSASRGRQFELRVVDAYRALGYQVTHNVGLSGKQTDVVAKREVSGAPPIALAIECKAHQQAIGNEEVHAFVNRVVSQRASNHISSGVLVSESGFTSAAQAVASGHPYVSLLSWDDLTSQVLDVRHQMRQIVEGYEASAIYQNYLPLALETLSWSQPRQAGRQSVELSAADLTADWLLKEPPKGQASRLLFVLADFGAGKTTLLRDVQYERTKAHLAGEEPRIPLFVPLRDHRDGYDITGLLLSSFREAYYRDLPRELLWQRIRDGRFIMLLDGFDEMADRSDANRRVELFYQLLEILRSPSPAILTSRPSYFVEREELERLLSALREQESSLTDAQPIPHGGSFAAADRLRRKLVERHREQRVPAGATDELPRSSVTMVRMLPMSSERIEEFVERHAAELDGVGASPADVIGFIGRTYDLTDLASRPLLLNLIIDVVVLGQIDIHDTERQYGASGLYEIYTHAKLDLDLAKGRSRQNGLSLELRRRLAEELAVAMYRQATLELDFHETLHALLTGGGELGEQLQQTGLSREEIATDLATCSFVNVNADGKCRFIHKSFRGFFVARVLKEHLGNAGHPLLLEPLEQEILYFLGGFAPTQPGVGERLWARFRRTQDVDGALRRNLLVAFLYTSPVHDSRRIADVEIADADFGSLTFSRSRMRGVSWNDVKLGKLRLEGVDWSGVGVSDSFVAELVVEGGNVALALTDATVESLYLENAQSDLSLEQSEGDFWRLIDSTATIVAGDGTAILRLRIERSVVNYRHPARRELDVQAIELVDSELDVEQEIVTSLNATGSIVRCHGGPPVAGRWVLRDCAVLLLGDEPTAGRPSWPAVIEWANQSTVVFASGERASQALTAAGWGVFGTVGALARPTRWPKEPPVRAWGVVWLDERMLAALPAEAREGCRCDAVIALGARAYEAAIGPGGPLSAAGELEARLSHEAGGEPLGELLAKLRRQYEEFAARDWPSVDLR